MKRLASYLAVCYLVWLHNTCVHCARYYAAMAGDIRAQLVGEKANHVAK